MAGRPQGEGPTCASLVVDSGRKVLARASLLSAKHRENVPSSYSYDEEASASEGLRRNSPN